MINEAAADQLAFGVNQLEKVPKVAVTVICFLLLWSFTVTLYYPPSDIQNYDNPTADSSSNSNSSTLSSLEQDQKDSDSPQGQSPVTQRAGGERRKTGRSAVTGRENCDLFSGEWVLNPEAPYYTNATCYTIQDRHNCMKYGRSDTDYLKWRWKPDGCELPVFDPLQFLEIVRGRSIAFVGDSVGRNHMQSLMCLLSSVLHPLKLSSGDNSQYEHWVYKDYNFNISMFSSPYLVRSEIGNPDDDVTSTCSLYLDEADESWSTKLDSYDYVIISSSQRTITPSHLESGEWDEGGDCLRRKRSFKWNETVLEDYDSEMRRIQIQELKIAQEEGNKRGLRFRLLDVTDMMLVRPDGHPGKYGHRPQERISNDCVHWCLPGPIDTLSDFLLELLKREQLKNSLNFFSPPVVQ
ncbi:OLC1v1011553C1 [Oldenlandia corymbosa var. corymbosa]|uniref:OLC1v1011553C1 n=1 Tax=Oldenlandia corymbosa var. corymbosa TaxID=529605 RepID=A0AAV1DX29_OLDCO|nr:OLC1v1011553C1 [Oldenlandia corymbosa var. corymbosa]